MLMTIKEVAQRLRISLSLAYRLVASGELRSYQVASCKRVSEEDLEAYLNQSRPENKRPPRGQGRHF